MAVLYSKTAFTKGVKYIGFNFKGQISVSTWHMFLAILALTSVHSNLLNVFSSHRINLKYLFVKDILNHFVIEAYHTWH